MVSKGKLIVLIHVPATKHLEKWHIYRYKPYPIQNEKGQSSINVSPEPLIAIGPGTSQKVLHETDLHHCLRRTIFIYAPPQLLPTQTTGPHAWVRFGLRNMSLSWTAATSKWSRNVKLSCSCRRRICGILSRDVYRSWILHQPDADLPTGSRTNRININLGCNLQPRNSFIEVPFSVMAPQAPRIETTGRDTLEIPAPASGRTRPTWNATVQGTLEGFTSPTASSSARLSLPWSTSVWPKTSLNPIRLDSTSWSPSQYPSRSSLPASATVAVPGITVLRYTQRQHQWQSPRQLQIPPPETSFEGLATPCNAGSPGWTVLRHITNRTSPLMPGSTQTGTRSTASVWGTGHPAGTSWCPPSLLVLT